MIAIEERRIAGAGIQMREYRSVVNAGIAGVFRRGRLDPIRLNPDDPKFAVIASKCVTMF